MILKMKALKMNRDMKRRKNKMYLVIAEKPSVGMSIAKVLGAYKKENGYLEGRDCAVSWCLGHLAQYAPPEAYDERYKNWNYDDLPIIPDQWKLRVASEKGDQFSTVKGLLNRPDITYVVNACDAGREGELIFWWVYSLSGSRLPVKRLWISSMEDDAIRDGFAHLRPETDYKDLRLAAVCRAQADWLVGMNATRAFTTKYQKRLVVGRVQTPILSMIADREREIAEFKKEKYFNISLDLGSFKAEKKKIFDEGEADRLQKRCDGAEAVVIDIRSSEKKESPPGLYDLTTLQREANRSFGMTALETLNAAQNLYEKKLVTYPRTDSRYLSEDMEGTVRKILPLARGRVGLTLPDRVGPDIKRVTDDKKVTDHHAIIPTVQIGNLDPESLKPGEDKILTLVVVRLLEATGEDHIYTETLAEIGCGGEIFTSRGKTVRQAGWKQYGKYKRNPDDQKKEPVHSLPALWKNQTFARVKAEKTKHYTEAPGRYSEDTLLSAMETAGKADFDPDTEKKGLGTPATRAAIIEKLIRSRYVARKGKQLMVTDEGMTLTEILPDFLKSPGMTAEWENQLYKMEKGEMDSAVFLNGIRNMITMMLNGCDIIPEEKLCRFRVKESVGVCPLCGKLVYEGKKNYYCSDRDCPFTLWKENRYFGNLKKTIDPKTAAELLKTGRVTMENLYSKKKDRYFTADIIMKAGPDGKTIFSMEFPEKKKK